MCFLSDSIHTITELCSIILTAVKSAVEFAYYWHPIEGYSMTSIQLQLQYFDYLFSEILYGDA